jgi:2-amino-4-hydroxy-6-hydroxymethyldihydropteridine diphosphokinase
VAQIVIGLGSNLDTPRRQLERAHAQIARLDGVSVLALSKVYESAPLSSPIDATFVVPEQPRYLNAAIKVGWSAAPTSLLTQLLSIEVALGRVRRERWGPRVIDLDLLWSSAGELRTPALLLPHPELERRAFALAPLLDVAPELAAIYGPALAACGGAPTCVGALAGT